MTDLKFLRLWDIYSPLLTPTQREIADMYFNLDLTVSEIAEQKGISRQGASECLSSVRKLLEEYEAKLGFSRMLDEGDFRLSLILTEVRRWADNFLAANPQFSAEVSALSAILGGDYSAMPEEMYNNINKVR